MGDKVLYNGQPIGILLADTQERAIEAARMVKVTYEAPSEEPSLTVQQVLSRKQMSRINNVVKVDAKKKGKIAKINIQIYR